MAAAGLVWLHLSGAKLLSVQTGSMVPTFKPGDALLIRQSPASQLKPGQIISYHNPRNPNLTITHRLISINPKTSWLTTAGDARRTADASFPPWLVTGRASLLLPGLGSCLDFLRSPLGLAIAVYLPTVSIILAEIKRLSHIYARPFYSARLLGC